jgi:alpha-mannosidase
VEAGGFSQTAISQVVNHLQGKANKKDAYQFGWTTRQSLYGHRISFQDFRECKSPYDQDVKGTFATINNDKVVLSTIKKAKWSEGWMIRLQEISGEDQVANISIQGKNITEAWQMDLLEKDIKTLEVLLNGTINVEVPAWGLSTIRVALKK